jgi:hypothetical protein
MENIKTKLTVTGTRNVSVSFLFNLKQSIEKQLKIMLRGLRICPKLYFLLKIKIWRKFFDINRINV